MSAAGDLGGLTNVRQFVGWTAEDTVTMVTLTGHTALLAEIPVAAEIVRSYEPKPGDRVRVLRGKDFAIVLGLAES